MTKGFPSQLAPCSPGPGALRTKGEDAPTAPSERGLPRPPRRGGSHGPLGEGAPTATSEMGLPRPPQRGPVWLPEWSGRAAGSHHPRSCFLGAPPPGLHMEGWGQAQPESLAGEPPLRAAAFLLLAPSSPTGPGRRPTAASQRPGTLPGRPWQVPGRRPGDLTSTSLPQAPRGHHGNTHISRPGSSRRPSCPLGTG